MENKILKYLEKYAPITPEIERAIEQSTLIRSYEKGTMLLKEGGYSRECFFVLKGCLRSYSLKNGEEQTIEFYTEEEVVTPISYGTSTPSSYYIECLEDTIASVGNPELEKETFEKFPELKSLSLLLAEKIMKKRENSFIDFKFSTPEERYLKLLQTRADLLQRVPQYHIASYLGIKPESLSRIRKRLVRK